VLLVLTLAPQQQQLLLLNPPAPVGHQAAERLRIQQEMQGMLVLLTSHVIFHQFRSCSAVRRLTN
jgi:hypothetical protein